MSTRAIPTGTAPLAPRLTLAEVLHRLGDIPAHRVRVRPAMGTARVEDLQHGDAVGCEIVDGILVEKPVGHEESFLATWLSALLNAFVVPRNLGFLTGEHGFIELPGGSVRGPDVAFYSWDRLPERRRPTQPVPQAVPDLAVEVLSRSNTPAEMERKRGEYFRAGVREVWEIEPRTRSVRVDSAVNVSVTHDATAMLSTPLLPGFTLHLAELFAELDRHG